MEERESVTEQDRPPKADKQLDARGLTCPEPVMLLHRTVREVSAGQLIDMVATDPSTTRDVPKFCHFLGHELVWEGRHTIQATDNTASTDVQEYRYIIRKSD